MKFSAKQREALKYLESVHWKDISDVFFGGAAGGGKAHPLSEPIITPFGEKMMIDVKVNDLVMGSNGYPTRVIAIHPQGKKQIFKVLFADGTFSRCCEDHLWLAHTARNRTKQERRRGKVGQIYTTKQLSEKTSKGYNMIIPLCEPVHFTPQHTRLKKFLKYHPYILGCLIGDGCILYGTPQITSNDIEIIDRIKELLPKGFVVNNLKSDYDYSIVNTKRTKEGYPFNPLTEWLKEIGLHGKKSHEKFIPKELLHANYKDRIELIKGLMDTDGSSSGGIEYSTVSKQLSEDVAYLLRSVGCKVRVSVKYNNYYVKDGIRIVCRDAYRLSIRSNNDSSLFYLKRKKIKCKPFNGGSSVLGKRILSIEKDGIEDAQCITVNSPDRLYLTRDFTVTHNTYLGCIWQIARRLKYPGTRGLIGRAKLKNLKLTTLITFFEVWNEFFEGKQDVTINLNHQDNVIYFSNGSLIFLKDLFHYPSDPDFTSLGSMEITDAFFDEVTEITEKAYTIACSRIRYKCVNDAPKALSAGNPSTNWVKTRFVIDADSRPVKLRDYEKFVASTLEDNPDEKFREIYKKQLEKLPLIDRMRLLHGDWSIIDNDNPFFYEFDYNSNTLPDIPMRNDVALILSFDFNVNPCTAVLGYQVHGEGNYWIKEFSVKGGTRAVLQQMHFIKELTQPLRITGDASGGSRQSSAVKTDYQIIEEFFRVRVEGRKARANSTHVHSKTVSNHMLYNVPCFISRKGCPQLINQILSSKQTKDGKLLKDDSPTGNHLVDCFRYFVNLIHPDVVQINKFADACQAFKEAA